MSAETNTPDQTTPATEVNPWSKEAHDAKVEVNRPTADNPRMLEDDDATILARFSEVPGEVLSGFITGFYFEGDTKMNIIELSQTSRKKRAAAGIDSATMIVPQSEIAPERARTAETSREQTVDEMGEKAVEATTLGPDIDSPDVDEHGRTFLTKAQIQAARRDANNSNAGFAPTSDELNEMMNPDAETDKGTSTVDANPYDALVNGEIEGSVSDAAMHSEISEDEKGLQAMREHNNKLNIRDQINNRANDYRGI